MDAGSEVGMPVLVTTAHRGVFFGFVKVLLNTENVIVLTQVQMAVMWSQAMKGVFGLASIGPDKGCRIGGAVPELTLVGVTAVAPCTPEAVKRFQDAPWA